jgi:transcriptional regulator with XRE-family HTH domain
MNEDHLELAITHLGLDLFDDEIKQQVETLLAKGQTVEPEARQRLIGIAKRALRHHAVQWAAFEVLAFETRREGNIDVDALAEKVGLDAATLRQIESGRSALEAFPPAAVAIWINELGIEKAVALRSVEESLRPKRREPAYAADEPPRLEESAQSFLEAVRTALETHECQ